MDYLQLVASTKNELIHIYEVLNKSGIFNNPKMRTTLVKYSLLKCIGELGTIMDSMYEEEAKDIEVRME